jgi:hypothetical protein
MNEKINRHGWLPSWQREIIVRYPLIYTVPSRQHLEYYARFPKERPAPDDYCNLRYGFECLEGWAGLIEELSATATSLVQALRAFGFHGDAQISPLIVKEKLGTFRWQGEAILLPPFDRLWQSYLHDIVHRSSCTCERSGKYGELRDVGRGWLMTLSAVEYSKELERRQKP